MEKPPSHSRVAPGRSCIPCRRRKIRCDRHHPCTYCAKFGLQCAYPEPVQEVRKQPASDLLSRLDRIEASLQRLETRGVVYAEPSASQSTPGWPDLIDDADPDGRARSIATSEHDEGKLVCEDSSARYVTGSVWTDLGDDDGETAASELNGPSSALNSESPSTSAESHHQGFIFGFRSAMTGLRQLHPGETGILTLWQVFLENVDPVLKIVHVPSTQAQIIRACRNLADVPPAFECLMFSIYFAAVTSIQSASACLTLLHEERQILLSRYRFGVEQALARARFMSTPDVPTLQALTLFLTCVRLSTDKMYVWSMTGLLVRLAMKLGLHRDPAALRLSPFACEMRRRLWWQIYILDIRVAEDNDMDPGIFEHQFDTKHPANVNDFDLVASMKQPAKETTQRSEMLFTLCRLEISRAARMLVFSPKFSADNGYPQLSLEGKNAMIDSVLQDLQERYMKHCDVNIPICYVAVSAAKMVLAKIKLTLHHPARKGAPNMTHDRLAELVASGIEILDYAQNLRSNEAYGRWLWLFQTYIEWDAVAFLLYSLTTSPLPTFVARAWKAVDAFFESWENRVIDGDRRWQRLNDLRSKAAAHPGSQGSGSSKQPEAPSAEHNHGKEPSIGIEATASVSQQALLSYTEFAYPEDADSGSHSASLDVRGGVPFPHTAAQDQVDWSFDGALYMQETTEWESDVDMSAFKSWL